MGVLLLADGGLQADGLLGDLENLPHLVHRHVHLLRDLLGGGVVPQLLKELAGDPDDLVDGLHHMDGDADGAGLVGDGPGDGLPDPPGGIGGELIALGVVELLHRLDESQVALLNEVEEEHSPAHVPLGDGDHQTEVGLGQPLLGRLPLLDGLLQRHLFLGRSGHLFPVFPGLLDLFQLLPGGVAGPHVLGQLNLLLGGQQIDLADLLEVHAHRVVDAEGVHQGIGVHDLLFGNLLNFLDGRHHVLGQLGQIVLPRRVNAHVLHGVVDFIHLLGVQVHILQHVHELAGGQLPLLLAFFQQFGYLFRAGDALDHLHQLRLAGFDLLLAGHLGLLIPRGLGGHFLFTHGCILRTLSSPGISPASPKGDRLRRPPPAWRLRSL